MSFRLVVQAVTAAAILAAAGSAQAAFPSAERSAAIRMIVALIPPVPASSGQLRAMMREADAIWRPYGVDLVWSTGAAGDLSADSAASLRVRFAHGTVPASGTAGPGAFRLGAIKFFDGDVADDVIVLSADEIAATVMSAPWAGRDLRQMPPAFIEDLIGRAVGRVLGHELGHYLLGLRTHTQKGLMRPSFTGRELVDWDRHAFGLDAAARLRLRARAVEHLQMASSISAAARD
jgi:hypothetical protein